MQILIILLMMASLLLPNFSHAAGKEGKAEIAFAEGMLAYHDGNYADAEICFSRAVHQDPNHAGAAFFLGMSYFQQEKYAEAADILKTAKGLNPNDPEPAFYRGVVLYRLDLSQNALPEFEQAYALAPEGPLKDLSNSYIRRITGKGIVPKEKRKKAWFFYSQLSTQYDSNVSLDPENLTVATLPSDQDDIQFAVQAGGGYHFVQRPKYRFTGEASYYQTIYPDLNEFNYGLAHAELRNQFASGNFFFNLPAAYEFSLLGTAKYLQSAQLSPALNYLAAKQFLSRLTIRGRYNAFFQTTNNEAQDRDAWNMQAEFAEYFYFDGQKRYFKVLYSFERNWADGDDWDFYAHTAGGAFYSPIAWEVSAYLYGAYTIDKKFSNVDSIIGTKRDDAHHYYGIRLARPIGDYVTLSIHYTFRRNSSNQAFFQYNKHLAGVTVGLRI